MATGLVNSGTPPRNPNNSGVNIHINDSPRGPSDNEAPISGGVAGPPDLSGLFPEFMPVGFPTIKPAAFQLTDPIDYANKVGANNRLQIGKNFLQSSAMALSTLDDELKGLKGFVPGAAALARGETAKDNISNQANRTSQVNSVLPNARGDLEAQRGRAATYAGGKLPFADDALRLQIGSRAADASSYAGFGAKSGQAAKISDLMTAEERFKIAQFGETLVGGNLQMSSQLLMAPTAYSNTGNQVRVMPEVGVGQLTSSNMGMLANATMLSPGAALQTEVGQQQFKTNLTQRTNEFNAQGTYDAAKFNSAGAFTAGLGLFNYDVGYANQIQAGNQAQLNMASGANVSGINAGNYNAGLTDSQASQTIQSTIQGLGALPQAFAGIQSVFGGGTVSTPSAAPPTQAAVQEAISLDTSSMQLGSGMGVDASTPHSFKLTGGASAPAGYSTIGGNSDGTSTVVSGPSYGPDIGQMAKNFSLDPSDFNAGNAGIADRNLSNAAALSYVAAPGLRQTALTGSGKPVYSLPAASDSTNAMAGRDNVANLALALGYMGESSEEVMGTLKNTMLNLSDPEVIARLDETYNTGGAGPTAQQIRETLFGSGEVDATTDAGQQLTFGSQRAGELWGSLSPYQKSMALTSLVGPTLNLKAGEDIAERKIPGTEKSIAGPLKVGDAIKLSTQGLNGFSLARNWNQLSAISAIAGNAKDPGSIARIMEHVGMLGYGPQGASVAVDVKQLQKSGAQPAPQFGVGAVFVNGTLPPHYKPLARTARGGMIAIPANLAHTSPLSNGNPNKATDAAVLAASGKHPAQRIWGDTKSPTGQVVRGSAGGSAIISGLGVMQGANSAIASSVLSHSLFANTLRS